MLKKGTINALKDNVVGQVNDPSQLPIVLGSEKMLFGSKSHLTNKCLDDHLSRIV